MMATAVHFSMNSPPGDIPEIMSYDFIKFHFSYYINKCINHRVFKKIYFNVKISAEIKENSNLYLKPLRGYFIVPGEFKRFR
jgi:hypothetical protein